jgi:hypothetical protein
VNPIGFRLIHLRWRQTLADRLREIISHKRDLLRVTSDNWGPIISSGTTFIPSDETPGKLTAFPAIIHYVLGSSSGPVSCGPCEIIRTDRRHNTAQSFSTNHDHIPTYTMDKLEEIPDITRVGARPIWHRLIIRLTPRIS